MTNLEDLNIKYFSLIILSIQNTASVLVGKLATSTSQGKFLNGTAVTLSESLKFIICIICLYARTRTCKRFCKTFIDEIFIKYTNTLKICIPSVLYVIQNILLLVALSNLPAAVFQVTYQMKILATALVSVVMLNKRLTDRQWLALFMLFCGVVMVNLKPNQSKNINSHDHSNYMLGLFSVLTICCTSAFSGVYFEKLVKVEKSDLLISNIQLSFTGMVFCTVSNFVTNRDIILSEGFLVGFNNYVWAYIILLSVGGLIVAVVVKYADNILKGFSTSIAIIISAVLSFFIFSYVFTQLFIIGTILVVSSVIIYSYG